MMKIKSTDISLEELKKYMEASSYKDFLKHISPSVFEEVASGNNRQKVLETVLKVLTERDPRNATEGYAEKVVDAMQKVAKNLKKDK